MLTYEMDVEFMSGILFIYIFWLVNQIAEGVVLEKTSCPLGVVLVVFESRPDALVQVKLHHILYRRVNIDLKLRFLV